MTHCSYPNYPNGIASIAPCCDSQNAHLLGLHQFKQKISDHTTRRATVQDLLHNPCGKSVKEILSKCKQQGPCDDMVSLLRAFTAKGFTVKDTQYLPWVQDHTGYPG